MFVVGCAFMVVWLKPKRPVLSVIWLFLPSVNRVRISTRWMTLTWLAMWGICVFVWEKPSSVEAMFSKGCATAYLLFGRQTIMDGSAQVFRAVLDKPAITSLGKVVLTFCHLFLWWECPARQQPNKVTRFFWMWHAQLNNTTIAVCFPAHETGLQLYSMQFFCRLAFAYCQKKRRSLTPHLTKLHSKY